MPNSAAASTLVVAATKCSSMSRAAVGEEPGLRGLGVGHRLLGREGLAGDDEQRLGRARAGAAPARGRGRRRWRRSGTSAAVREGVERGTTICGPRSLPPMPMLTTWRSGRVPPARVAHALRRRRASRRAPAWTSALNGAAPARRAQRGVQHGAALGGVDRRRRQHRVAPRLDAAFARQVGEEAQRRRVDEVLRQVGRTPRAPRRRAPRSGRVARRTPRAGRSRGRAPRSGRRARPRRRCGRSAVEPADGGARESASSLIGGPGRAIPRARCAASLRSMRVAATTWRYSRST